MAKTVTIQLDEPIEGHPGDKPITRIVIRAPTYEDYMGRGEPFEFGIAPGSRIPFMVENKDIIREYAELLVIEPKDVFLLRQADYKVARKVKRAIMDFFRDGGEASEGSPT